MKAQRHLATSRLRTSSKSKQRKIESRRLTFESLEHRYALDGSGALQSSSMLALDSATTALAPANLVASSTAVSTNQDVATVVSAMNQFAFDLYSELPADQQDRFFSPYSVNAALVLLLNGAKDSTRDQIVNALHLNDLSDARLDAALGSLMDSLVADGQNGAFDLSIANSLFGQDPASDPSIVYSRQTLDIINNYFHGGLSLVDFEHDPGSAITQINQWASDHTNGTIKEIVNASNITVETRLVLVNAIYFKGQWQNGFDPSQTSDAPFTWGDGSTKTVSMMNQNGDFNYTEDANYQILEMPYQGNQLSMIVVLPKENAASQAGFSADQFSQWLNQLRNQNVNVSFPKFQFDTSYELADTLQSLGITSAFDPGEANLSGFETAGLKNLYVSHVIHKAHVDVEETGTIASAVTVIIETVFDSAYIPPGPPPVVFDANHPFQFFIVDRTTNAILFMGSQGQGTSSLPLGSIGEQTQSLLNAQQFHNLLTPCDVNSDGFTTPLDALLIINHLKSNGITQLSSASPATLKVGNSMPQFDVNDDGWLTPLDALQVINDLHGTGQSSLSGAGKPDSVAGPSMTPAVAAPNLALPAVATLIASNAAPCTDATFMSPSSNAASSASSSNVPPTSTSHDVPFLVSSQATNVTSDSSADKKRSFTPTLVPKNFDSGL